MQNKLRLMWLPFSVIRLIGDINCSNVNVVKSLRTCNFFYAVGADLCKSSEKCKMAYFEAGSFEMNRDSSESGQRRRR